VGVFRSAGSHLQRWIDRPVPKRSAARRVGLAVVCFALLFVTFSTSLKPDTFEISAGQLAPKDIRATREVIDRVTTERLRDERAALVKDVYELDDGVLAEMLDQIEKAYSAVRVIALDPSIAREQKIDGLMELADVGEQAAAAFLRYEEDAFDELEEASKEAATRVLTSGVRTDAIEISRAQIDAEVETLASRFTKDARTFAAGLTKRFLAPNLVPNEAETARMKQEARAAVEPVKVLRGQLILRAGEIVTDYHMVLLRDLGFVKAGPDVRTALASALLAAIVLSALAMYLWRFERPTFYDDSRLLLITFVFFGTLMFSAVLNRVSGYMMPVAAGTMLLAVMIEPRFALLSAVALGVSSSIISGNDVRFLLTALAGSTAGVFAITHIDQRADLMKAGIAVSVVNVLSILSLSLIDGVALSEIGAMEEHFWGVLNGVVSATLTMGLLPFFEGVFGVITPVKLIELSNPNQPLLKRLLVEAPGTYHHSVLVGNLAEAAAEGVGGDSLLARVGAYYHDVGKTKRPYFFIENQMGMENPHDKTSPTLSTLIITSHVRDGVELAREHKLPERIIDFIREHHGTTLVGYFYSKATEGGKAQDFVEADFRYEGPRPTSKETAIVMLADSTEAAVRAVGKPTPGRIEAIVKKIIKDRLNDHQLDRCDLTLRDLDTIADIFTRVLSGLFHPRVEYPEYQQSRNQSKQQANGQEHQKTAGKEGKTGGSKSNGVG